MLEGIGYDVGRRLVERLTHIQNKPGFKDTLEIVSFVCREVCCLVDSGFVVWLRFI